jgi:PAS domain S-box-containing protein
MAFAGSEHHPHRVLNYSVTLLALLLLAYAAFFSWQSRRDAESEQSGRLAMIAELSGIAIDTYFTQLEIGMRNLGMDLAGTGKKFDPDLAYTLVNRFQNLHTELGNIILIRADGQVLLTGKIHNRKDLPTLAKDTQFLKFRDELRQSSPFVIGQPVFGNIDKSWVVAARFAITNQDGKLIYILSANLPNDMMKRFRGDTAIPGIAAMGLVRDDGYLVNRYPDPNDASMDTVYGEPVTGAMFEYLRNNHFPPHGQAEETGGTAQIVYAMRRLEHYPLTLFVEMPSSEIKAATLRKVRTTYSLLTLMMAGLLVFYGLSIRRRRIWSMEKRRQMHRLEYERALFERSPNEIYMFDEHTLQFVYANDYALDNLGYTLEEMQNRNIFSLHPELSVENFGEMIEPLRRREQESIKYRTTQMRANGSTYPVEVNLQLITADEGDDFLAIINDITALKEAEDNINIFNSPEERRGSARKRKLTASG